LNRDFVAEGSRLVEAAVEHAATPGRYALQAAIAAVHAQSADAAATDWTRIIVLYTLLERSEPTPVVALNRAVAIAMRDGPQAGLELIDALMARGELDDYHFAHAARAELLRRMGRHADARSAYERALACVKQEPERRVLEQRLRQSAA
jgi:RNA polymerase sigma-70 factor (ECF subfamily)